MNIKLSLKSMLAFIRYCACKNITEWKLIYTIDKYYYFFYKIVRSKKASHLVRLSCILNRDTKIALNHLVNGVYIMIWLFRAM